MFCPHPGNVTEDINKVVVDAPVMFLSNLEEFLPNLRGEMYLHVPVCSDLYLPLDDVEVEDTVSTSPWPGGLAASPSGPTSPAFLYVGTGPV